MATRDDEGTGWREVRLLSLTSLLADVSGEMLVAILPFLLVAQGATGFAVAAVGAASEATGHLVKALGGRWGESARAKRPLVAAGYLGAAAARFGIAAASTWLGVLAWRSVDRVGKGLRTAPRDAMLAAAVPAAIRNRAFAYHRAADTLGAVAGVVAVLALLAVGHWDARRITFAAAVVGLAAALPLAFLREPGTPSAAGHPDGGRPHAGFRAFVAVSAVYAFGQVSVLLFLLRAAPGSADSAILAAVGWYLWFNVVYAGLAVPCGRWADRFGKHAVLTVGMLLMAAACLAMLLAPSALVLGVAFTVMGAAYAATDATGRSMAAGLAGSKTSTHLGTYHAALGLASLAGGLVAGAAWDRVSPEAAFLLGAGVCAGAAAAMARIPRGSSAVPA